MADVEPTALRIEADRAHHRLAELALSLDGERATRRVDLLAGLTFEHPIGERRQKAAQVGKHAVQALGALTGLVLVQERVVRGEAERRA